ncbi:homoserine kinase [Zhihengliuella sp.]|uniref:homoserine kinase n=1 Tax=Zhihengliuella sp. TaxID=1954483 RepID=UPI0028116F6E|nr:homoserine kinase [Zhihengliuella sp.]
MESAHAPRIRTGQHVTVTVPATTANLGPGFDSLGLALDLTDTLEVRTLARGGLDRDLPGGSASDSAGTDSAATGDAAALYEELTTPQARVRVLVTGEGAESLPDDETHLIARTILERWEQLGVAAADLEIRATNRIPHGRGLGSSAAAIVSALAAADALLPETARGGLDGRDALFEEAARLEGHPDNVAPAVYGGLTLSLTDDGGMRTHRLPLDAEVVPVVAIPDVELSTRAARGLLPATVPHADAAANSGRAGLLIHALTSAPELLHEGTRDYLHQDYRAEAMPESSRLIAALRAAGYAATVSGAGPTVLILAHGSDQAEAVAARVRAGEFDDGSGAWRVEIPGLCASGVMVERH